MWWIRWNESNFKSLSCELSAETCLSKNNSLCCGAWPSGLRATCWKFLPLPLAVWFSQVKKSLWKEKNMPMAANLLLCLFLYERVKGNGIHSTAVGSLQYFLILSAVQTQTAVSPDSWFLPSDSLSRTQQITYILVSCALGALWQRAGSRTASSTKHVSELHHCCFYFFSIFCVTLICRQALSYYSLPQVIVLLCYI